MLMSSLSADAADAAVASAPPPPADVADDDDDDDEEEEEEEEEEDPESSAMAFFTRSSRNLAAMASSLGATMPSAVIKSSGPSIDRSLKSSGMLRQTIHRRRPPGSWSTTGLEG